MRFSAVPLLAVTLVSTCLADYIGVPSWRPSPAAPRYFSGTACRIEGNVGLTGLDEQGQLRHLVRMELWIGDTMVKESEPVEMRSVGGLGVIFDSTHFAHGSDVEVTFRAWANDSVDPLEAYASIPVYNKAMVYGNSQMNSGQSAQDIARQQSCDDAVSFAKTALESLNFNTSLHHQPGSPVWNKSTFLGSIHHSTALHVTTHGWSGGACPYNSSAYLCPPGVSSSFQDHSQHIHQSDVYVAKADAFGGPFIFTLPPFNQGPNSTYGPGPFGVVLLDSCHVGSDMNFLTDHLLPWTNTYANPNLENQAVVGWDSTVSQIGAKGRSEAFWGALAIGKTASQAWNAMAIEEASLGSQAYPGVAVIYGDPFARITSVYTGDATIATNGWYR